MGASLRLSIGVPVYNGAKYIRETLDSILAQTFTDFELIISDNASTDATQAICEEYVRRDPRVRYFRNAKNLGPGPNYNRCVDVARGELFKWQAADDLIEPTFCQRCIEMLDANPQMSAVYTQTRCIDLDSKLINIYQYDLDIDTPGIATRLRRFMFANHRVHTCHEFWCIARMSVLRETALKGSYPSADRIVVAELLTRGPIGRVEEPLFCNREHPNRSTHSVVRKEQRLGSRLSRYLGGGPTPCYEWWIPEMRGKINFPEWKWVAEYVNAVRHAPLEASDKFKCYATLGLLYVKFTPRLMRDLAVAGELLFYRVFKSLAIPTAPTAPDAKPATPQPSPRRAA